MVMVVIFIVAGVAAPRFAEVLPSYGLRKAADQVYATLHHARNEAATYGVRTRFVVANSAYRLTIERRPLKEADVFETLGSAWEPTELPGETGFATLDGFTTETGESYLEFRGDGTASADATIVLRSESGEERTLVVTGATGQVRFKEVSE